LTQDTQWSLEQRQRVTQQKCGALLGETDPRIRLRRILGSGCGLARGLTIDIVKSALVACGDYSPILEKPYDVLSKEVDIVLYLLPPFVEKRRDVLRLSVATGDR
jgi:hypothetical protein